MKFRIVFDREREEEIVAHVHERTPLLDRIEELVAGSEGLDELTGYDGEDVVRVKPDTVAAFYIEDGKTYVACTDGRRCRIRMHLYELEEALPPGFRKINKSCLANMKHIVRYKASLNGAMDAVFTGGFRDYVSRRCYAELKKEYSL